MELIVKTQIVEDVTAWNRMVERLECENVLAIDTETVGFESLELYAKVEEARKKLYKEALRHVTEFPKAGGGNSIRGAKKSLAKVKKARSEVTKLETAAMKSLDGLRFWRSHCGCFQIGLEDGTCYAIRPQNFHITEWQKLGKIINNAKTLILQNAVFDIKVIAHNFGFWLDGRKIFDTKLAEWILHNGLNPRTSLKTLAKKYLGYTMSKDVKVRVSNWLGPWTKKQVDYACLDVVVLFPIMEAQKKELLKKQLKRAHRLRCDFLTPNAILDMSGLPLDIPGLEKFREETQKKLNYLETELRIQAQAPDDFNPNSPAQVYDALTKAEIFVPDSNEKTLKKSDWGQHPLVEALLDYRGTFKLLGYIDKYLKWSRDGRMYSQFHIDGTETGRLSSGSDSKDPYYTNAQNPPTGRFRDFIAAPPGHVFINADYSQIEIRWMARFSKDPVMMQAYMDGKDLHTITALIVAGLTAEQFAKLPEEKQKEIRKKAKAVNFGLLFGSGWRGLQNYAKIQYDVTLSDEEAQKIVKAWKALYDSVTRYQYYFPEEVNNRQNSEGITWLRTASGFIRYFNLNNEKRFPDGRVYTDALNTPIQGSAADGMINAVNMLVYGLIDDGYVPLVDFWLPTVVHDEILLECLEEYAEDFKERVVSSMIRGMNEFILNVPVEVEPKIVPTWAEGK